MTHVSGPGCTRVLTRRARCVVPQLNATSEMIPVTWPEIANMHPFAPADQTVGYMEMIKDLSADLCDITGFAAMSMQPNVRRRGRA